MSLADSILQTASIVRWMSVAGTATDHMRGTLVILSERAARTAPVEM
jgi:hypothetical protein